MLSEFAFELAASNIRFGSGATREVGADIADLRLKSALVFTDPNLRNLPPVSAALESLEANGIAFRLYDRVRVEPSDQSLAEASAIRLIKRLRRSRGRRWRIGDRYGEGSEPLCVLSGRLT